MCCFQATERLRRSRCSYKLGLYYPLLPTLSHFLWGPPRFLSNGYGKAMKLTYLRRGLRSRMWGALPLYFLYALTPWCSRTHTALCINKAFICNKVKYQGRHTVSNYHVKFNLTEVFCIHNLITADYNSLSSDVNIYHEFRTKLIYKTALPSRFQEKNTFTLHERCINLARRVAVATIFFTVLQRRS